MIQVDINSNYGFRRESLIEDIVGRNVELPVCINYEVILSEKEKFVLDKLKINGEIIYNAKAILATTRNKYDSFNF